MNKVLFFLLAIVPFSFVQANESAPSGHESGSKESVSVSHYALPRLSEINNIKPSPDALLKVNKYWNKFAQNSDKNKEKSWQTPEQTYKLKSGTTEDIVIGKYFDLISRGVPKENLKIAIVELKENSNKKEHIVLICFDKKNNYVLDTLNEKIIDLKNRKDIVSVKTVINYNGVFMKNSGFTTLSFKWAEIRNNFNKHVSFLRKMYQENS